MESASNNGMSADNANATLPHITLASASPRRKELLARIGIEVIVRTVDAPEESITTATVGRSANPHELCRRVTLARARLKAAAVARDPATPFALAADTTVDAGGVLLDKPADESDARFMLRHLSGMTHQVHSSVILYDDHAAPDRWYEETVTTHVTFAPLTDSDLEWYFRSEEWRGVAGGYRIQGLAGAFVQNLQGSYEAVMGLPIHTVYSMINRFFQPDKS